MYKVNEIYILVVYLYNNALMVNVVYDVVFYNIKKKNNHGNARNKKRFVVYTEQKIPTD